MAGFKKGARGGMLCPMGKLTPAIIKELTEPGRYSDVEGLFLQISPSGGKSWLMRVQINGRRRDIGLGELRRVSLRDARLEAAAIKKLAKSGVDPFEERRKVEIGIPTFEQAAKRAHAEMIRGLPRQPRKTRHFAALSHAQVPAFMKHLLARRISSSRMALEALILTAVRSGEVRGTKWAELSEDLTLLTIPAERMKADAEHVVPLSPQAADVFRQARTLRMRGYDLIFPGATSGSALSDRRGKQSSKAP